MKKIIKASLLASSFLLSFAIAAAPAVIVNPANDSQITEQDVKRLFLGKAKSFANGTAAIPVVADNSDGAYLALSDKVLKKNQQQLNAYWAKMTFTGKGTPPKAVGSIDEVKAFVANNPGAIGVIDSSAADSTVKVVL